MVTLRLRYEGEFNFQGLYEHISGFFSERNYDLNESNWKEKDATPAGREIMVKFKPSKNVTEYVKYNMQVEWKSVDAHPTTQGQMFARFHIYVDFGVEVDWQGYSNNNKGLARLYKKYIFDKQLDEIHNAQVQEDAQTLIEEIREFLGTEI